MAYNMIRLFEEIEARVSEDPGLKLHDLAADLGVERHTIEKAVRNARSVCFRDYRRPKRLNKAIRLLEGEAALNRDDIADLLHYKSSAALSRFVRKMTGKTPTQFRN